MLRLLGRGRERPVGVPPLTTTDYINTIPPEREPWFPGDEYVERRIRAYVRWNAASMVHRAQRPEIGVGGHISTYASAASLYEVGFNHFFRGKDHPGGGDQIYFQGHASPGIYARAYLEGRLTEDQLDGFRQEVSHPGGGLSSYPHPRLMPDFWEFPTVSMGLGPLNAIYQARFNRYLHDRGIKDTSDQHVWAFLGDGEMDEPESLGAIGLAAREELDNLTFVINCNLQRLDGPVRGNGKIIQQLESFFRGAGWNVIKVIWGREWDRLYLDIPDSALEENPYLPPYYHPGQRSDEYEYLQERRSALGGFLPSRRTTTTALSLPPASAYEDVKRGSGKQKVATTMAFVRLLKDLMKDKEFGKRWVPIIPDEARTFGMDSLFPTAKIYSPHGQNYTPVDRELFLSYKEAVTGQILHEGINEAGSVASFTAAGSSFATHGEPMIPLYIFYSMFGFQRTGDGLWAAADQMAKGFLLGATAGRTTLVGEGLQHNDGHSCCWPRRIRRWWPTTRRGPSRSAISFATGSPGCT